MRKTFGILLLLLALLGQEAYAQRTDELTTRSGRARRAFERALDAYRLRDYEGTIDALNQAVRADGAFIEAHILLGEVFHSAGDYDSSIQSYKNALEIDPRFFPPAWFYLGEAFILSGRYQEALERFERFLEFPGVSRSLAEAARNHLLTCEFAIDAMNNPVPFEPVNLGAAVNSEFAEYSPALTTDEQTLIFTRKKPRESPAMAGYTREQEDFYVSYWEDGAWSPAQNLGPPINTPGNEGAQSISADGREMFFTACNRPDGMGSCDIYYAVRVGDDWSRPRNLGPVVNSSSWDSQPSISPDGNTLFFASGRPGSTGRMDIWYTTRDSNGQWEEPRNMGPVINTEGRDMSPFIHPDNRTLYFASDGHLGMGGLDLFVTRRQDDGSWSTPQNLGYPINTHAEEFSLIVSASGTTAYFASDLYGGYGDMDLYMFELHEEARPSPVTYMRGVVFDRETQKPLAAGFQLLDVVSGEVVLQATSDQVSGDFLVAIPTERELALNVSKAGYLFFSEHFSYEAREDLQPYIRDIPLQPIRKGETVILRNIFFDTDRYDLRAESRAELRKLVELLEQNPGMHIRINGHTDSTGSPAYNQRLSENRARSVYDFLTAQGIESNRLSYQGFGETMPIDTNETEEGRANNRRTEFEIVELNQP
jgi:outer membrane protein OmpA-like peptidoglycan-associated protein/Tol biopolymer transport system component